MDSKRKAQWLTIELCLEFLKFRGPDLLMNSEQYSPTRQIFLSRDELSGRINDTVKEFPMTTNYVPSRIPYHTHTC